jgi:hypothetical protein
MKTKKLEGKLNLKKSTVVNLSALAMAELFGGYSASPCGDPTDPFTTFRTQECGTCKNC